MRGNMIRNLTKEYLNLGILPYSLAVMWKQIDFWGAQYVYNGTDYNRGRHYVEWLYGILMTGGGGQ